MNHVLALQRLALDSDPDQAGDSLFSLCCEGSTQSAKNCCNTWVA